MSLEEKIEYVRRMLDLDSRNINENINQLKKEITDLFRLSVDDWQDYFGSGASDYGYALVEFTLLGGKYNENELVPSAVVEHRLDKYTVLIPKVILRVLPYFKDNTEIDSIEEFINLITKIGYLYEGPFSEGKENINKENFIKRIERDNTARQVLSDLVEDGVVFILRQKVYKYCDNSALASYEEELKPLAKFERVRGEMQFKIAVPDLKDAIFSIITKDYIKEGTQMTLKGFTRR